MIRKYTLFQDVMRFHHKFGLPMPGEDPNFMTEEVFCFRYQFMLEELKEIVKAQQDRDLIGFADGIVDLVYVALGTAGFTRVDFDRHWEANFEKITSSTRSYFDDVRVMLNIEDTSQGVPELPDLSGFTARVGRITESLAGVARYHHPRLDLIGVTNSLIYVVFNCCLLALECDIPFNELWDEVQRANMKKKRAGSSIESAARTGRGSSFDVVKPAGWMPPNIGGVLASCGADVTQRMWKINRDYVVAYEAKQAHWFYCRKLGRIPARADKIRQIGLADVAPSQRDDIESILRANRTRWRPFFIVHDHNTGNYTVKIPLGYEDI